MTSCPSRRLLSDYARGALEPDQADAVASHLVCCRRCADIVARSDAFTSLLAQVRDAEQQRKQIEDALSQLPEIASRISTTLGEPPSPPKPAQP